MEEARSVLAGGGRLEWNRSPSATSFRRSAGTASARESGAGRPSGVTVPGGGRFVAREDPIEMGRASPLHPPVCKTTPQRQETAEDQVSSAGGGVSAERQGSAAAPGSATLATRSDRRWASTGGGAPGGDRGAEVSQVGDPGDAKRTEMALAWSGVCCAGPKRTGPF